MTLELDRLAARVPAFVERYHAGLAVREAGVAHAKRALARWATDPAAARARIRAAFASDPRPYALDTGEPVGLHVGAPPAGPVTVVAADGSSIEPDRFAPVQCFVVNVGTAVFSYGTPDPVTMTREAELGPAEADESEDDGEVPYRGWGVNLRRDVAELEAAASAAAGVAGPCVVLLDGTLLPWDLDSRQVDASVREDLALRTLAALDRLRAAPGVAVGAYVSGSRACDVVNSLSALAEGPALPLSDAHLFARLLHDGQRSALFSAESGRRERVEQRFKDHAVWFFYLRIGGDVARVELPAWVGDAPERVARLHATLVDQCARCDGYPRALQEAHELAVIDGADREAFARLVEDEAARFGLRPVANGKAASKRRRAL